MQSGRGVSHYKLTKLTYPGLSLSLFHPDIPTLFIDARYYSIRLSVFVYGNVMGFVFEIHYIERCEPASCVDIMKRVVAQICIFFFLFALLPLLKKKKRKVIVNCC